MSTWLLVLGFSTFLSPVSLNHLYFSNHSESTSASCSHLDRLERRLKRGGSKEEEEENEGHGVVEGHGEESKEGEGDVKEEENVFLQLYSAFPGDKGCWAVFLLQLHR